MSKQSTPPSPAPNQPPKTTNGGKAPTTPNWPSKTGKPSGGRRGNNPPGGGKR